MTDDNTLELDEALPEVPPELSRNIKVEQIKGDHFELTVTADKAECQALAKRFGLIELTQLEAELIFTTSPDKSSIHVKASFTADMMQRCVVTLEPVPAHVEGDFWCDYASGITPEDVEIIEFDEATEDPPEPIIDGEFDVGIMLTEHFGLQLNPFPRAPGADFDEIKKATNGKLEEGESNNPFAVLKNLK